MENRKCREKTKNEKNKKRRIHVALFWKTEKVRKTHQKQKNENGRINVALFWKTENVGKTQKIKTDG